MTYPAIPTQTTTQVLRGLGEYLDALGVVCLSDVAFPSSGPRSQLPRWAFGRRAEGWSQASVTATVTDTRRDRDLAVRDVYVQMRCRGVPSADPAGTDTLVDVLWAALETGQPVVYPNGVAVLHTGRVLTTPATLDGTTTDRWSRADTYRLAVQPPDA